MDANSVGRNYPNSFGNFVLAYAPNVNVGATSNSAATLSVVGTKYIVRRITVTDANQSIATANVSILTSNDGNTSNAVAAAQVLGNVTSSTRYQDLSLASATITTAYTAPALFVRVVTASSGGTCDVTVYGDVVDL